MGCGQSASQSPHVDTDWKSIRMKAINQDLSLILAKANLPLHSISVDTIIVLTKEQREYKATVVPGLRNHKSISLKIEAIPSEVTPTLYWALHNLGFLFPHPNTQISPTLEQILSTKHTSYAFSPRFSKRGFHLNTRHPNEWINGFMQGNSKVATDYIRWSARNFQNTIQIELLSTLSKQETMDCLKVPFQFAHDLGMHVGVAVSMLPNLECSASLLSPPNKSSREPSTGQNNLKNIQSNLNDFISTFPISFNFLSIDIVRTKSSDQSSIDAELALIEAVRKILASTKKDLFIKVLPSTTGPDDPKYPGVPFNYLPKFADKKVGVLPSTTAYFSLTDDVATVYGKENLNDLLSFIYEVSNDSFTSLTNNHQVFFQESKKRPVWFLAETSRCMGLDIDVPLLLTDILVARSQDMDTAVSAGVVGHLTSTSGHACGYWLFDWTVALLSCNTYSGKYLIALEKLGENTDKWSEEISFQKRFFKKKGVYKMLASCTPLDEMTPPAQAKVLTRHTLKELYNDATSLQSEISVLEETANELLHTSSVHNAELKGILEVTHMRVSHALLVRKALYCTYLGQGTDERDKLLAEAADIRKHALLIMKDVTFDFMNFFPSAGIFDRDYTNPTTYKFGYAWTAKHLHYWEREESMVKAQDFDARFMNIFTNLTESSGL